jgi:hypothetical protein
MSRRIVGFMLILLMRTPPTKKPTRLNTHWAFDLAGLPSNDPSGHAAKQRLNDL